MISSDQNLMVRKIQVSNRTNYNEYWISCKTFLGDNQKLPFHNDKNCRGN